MKELRAMFGFLLAITVGYLYIYDGSTIRAGAGGSLITLPAVGSQMALGDLFKLINTNNPSNSSNFLIWNKNTKRWVGAQTIGCNAGWYKQYSNTMVTLISDTALVNALIKNNQIQAKDKTKALRVWLYFELALNGQIYRFYVNDPNPGKIVKTAVFTIYPGQQIMNKYK